MKKDNLRGKALVEAFDIAKAKDPTLTQAEFAASIEMTPTCFVNRYYQAKALIKAGVIPAPKHFKVKTFNEYFRLQGNFMIVGDTHVPYTDWDFAALVGLIAEKHLPPPRKLILAGDFFSFDQFSTYAQIVACPSWKTERKAAKHLLKLWFETFDEIYGLMGNHDRRLQKFVAGAFDETDIISLVYSNPDKLKWSNYGYCIVDTPTGEWRITHPKNYGINQLSVAETLTFKHRQNIISHHEHHAAIGFDRYGWNVIVNNGCLLEQNKLTYVALDDSKSASMMKAFCMLKDGYPYLFCDNGLPFTDWSKWL